MKHSAQTPAHCEGLFVIASAMFQANGAKMSLTYSGNLKCDLGFFDTLMIQCVRSLAPNSVPKALL